MPWSDSPVTTYPEPLPGEPVELPVELGPDEPARQLVHTELGVPIFFDAVLGRFEARMHPVEGRGSESVLHAERYDAILTKIRERALVVPVVAYLLAMDELAEDDEALVRAIVCTVVEYHHRRQEPYVIRVDEPARRSAYSPLLGRSRTVTMVRTTDRVYLPEAGHLDALRAATRAIRDEHDRHRAAVTRLLGDQRDALDAIPLLTPTRLGAVQVTGEQPSVGPAALGLVVFDRREDEEDD